MAGEWEEEGQDDEEEEAPKLGFFATHPPTGQREGNRREGNEAVSFKRITRDEVDPSYPLVKDQNRLFIRLSKFFGHHPQERARDEERNERKREGKEADFRFIHEIRFEKNNRNSRWIFNWCLSHLPKVLRGNYSFAIPKIEIQNLFSSDFPLLFNCWAAPPPPSPRRLIALIKRTPSWYCRVIAIITCCFWPPAKTLMGGTGWRRRRRSWRPRSSRSRRDKNLSLLKMISRCFLFGPSSSFSSSSSSWWICRAFPFVKVIMKFNF